DVVVEVLRDVGVMGEVGIGLRHREVRVLHALARGVDVQGAVRGGHPVAVAVHPVATDAVRLLVRRHVEPALRERLDGGDAGGAGADHAGGGERHGVHPTSRMPDMAIEPDAAEVKASGGVVWRRGERGVEVVVVHRPRYDDWSLPKGKLDPGEGWEQAAVREVLEEVGLRCSLGEELPPAAYTDHKGRAKVVRYWLMEPED